MERYAFCKISLIFHLKKNFIKYGLTYLERAQEGHYCSLVVSCHGLLLEGFLIDHLNISP